MQKLVSFKHLHNTLEGWREEAGGRHEGPKQFHRTCSFQNGRSFVLAINPSERGFYMQGRPARHISNHSDCRKITDLSKVSLERETVPIHMSTFWPQILSKNFYKGSETPLGLPQSSVSSSAGVFSRHTYHGSNPRAMYGAYPADMAVVDRFGFSGKPEEVSVNSQTAERISWEFHRNETVFLMEEKLLRSKLEAECLLKSNPVVKMLASFWGFCQSTLPAIAVAPLHVRKLQADMIKAIKSLRGRQGYWSVVHLFPETKTELEWWRDHLKMNNGKSILPPEEQETIFTDASKQGWGAHLNLEKIGGRCIWEEKVDTHINMLELKAAFFALQAFLLQLKQQHIQFGIDNKTAVAYINKLGGTHSRRLTSLALEM